jgi:hypothetical protein
MWITGSWSGPARKTLRSSWFWTSSAQPSSRAMSLTQTIREVSCERGLSLDSRPPVARLSGVVSPRLPTFSMVSSMTVGLSS